MKKSSIFTAMTAAAALSTSAAADGDMEKCAPYKDGNNIYVKEGKADCKSSAHSCSGQKKEKDSEAWIMVPKGQCEKIQAGNLEGFEDKVEKVEEEQENKAE